MNAQPTMTNIAAPWSAPDISTYLGRCQIDTPSDLVDTTWRKVLEKRPHFDLVIDLGAGDGRFAKAGRYSSYIGYEIDAERFGSSTLPDNATIRHECAFSAPISGASLCIGNPPFVRNQDLPEGWREQIAAKLNGRSGIKISGLANAWLYFFVQSLEITSTDGVCALVVPFEWTSRPSAAALRKRIIEEGWSVDVYRLCDRTFESVLTTSSITIVDKGDHSGRWRYFELDRTGAERAIISPTGTDQAMIAYGEGSGDRPTGRIRRGVSPGTQKVFVLTESTRARHGLRCGVDVVPCITSLRHLPRGVNVFTSEVFERYYRSAGQRCWLLVPDRESTSLNWSAYVNSIDPALHDTATCNERANWWEYKMPEVPTALIATCFKGHSPKCTVNEFAVHAVGGVAGLHNVSSLEARRFVSKLSATDLRPRIVPHANGLFKCEIGQLNRVLAELTDA